jgi:hypothetical protein
VGCLVLCVLIGTTYDVLVVKCLSSKSCDVKPKRDIINNQEEHDENTKNEENGEVQTTQSSFSGRQENRTYVTTSNTDNHGTGISQTFHVVCYV